MRRCTTYTCIGVMCYDVGVHTDCVLQALYVDSILYMHLVRVLLLFVKMRIGHTDTTSCIFNEYRHTVKLCKSV